MNCRSPERGLLRGRGAAAAGVALRGSFLLRLLVLLVLLRRLRAGRVGLGLGLRRGARVGGGSSAALSECPERDEAEGSECCGDRADHVDLLGKRDGQSVRSTK